jgi:hypothetical protein
MRWRRFGTGVERVRSGEHDTQQVASVQPWIDYSIVGAAEGMQKYRKRVKQRKATYGRGWSSTRH